MRATAALLALLAASAARPARAAPAARPEAPASTGTARAAEPSPVTLTFVKGRSDWRLEAGYSLRWDFDDLGGIYPDVRRLMLHPAALLRVPDWDVTENTRLMLYGMRVDPWKLLFEKRPGTGGATGAAGGDAAPTSGGAPPSRRFRVSLRPFIDDIERRLPDDLRRMALRESLNRLNAGARRLDDMEREAILRDMVLTSDELRLPYTELPTRGLQTLLGEDKSGR